jgi:polysaccharide export outer membrane protein
LNGHYTVQNDGTFTILGLQSPIKAAGMTVQAFETELKRRFVADGYFTHPQLTVSVEQYKSKKVYVYGEIRAPAAYPLTGGMTLIEAIMMAGGPSSANPGQAIVVRAHGGGAAGTPTVAVHDGDGADADIIHVDISKWQDGAKDKYLPLEDGDIIQVMQAENVFMFGEVNHQGAYPVTRTSTVQQMLTVAGGFTIDAATGEVRIVRMVNGKKTEIKVKSDKFPLELVKPGDTIVVRARRF